MAHFQRETGSASLETGTGYHETIGSPDSEIGCLPFRVRFRLARNGHALKSQRGFRPVAGKTHQLKGNRPPGRRRKKLVHRLILIEAKPAKRMSAGQERC